MRSTNGEAKKKHVSNEKFYRVEFVKILYNSMKDSHTEYFED